MAQHEDLDILGTIPAAAQDQQVDHKPDETVETGHAVILVDGYRAHHVAARNPRSTSRTDIRHPQVRNRLMNPEVTTPIEFLNPSSQPTRTSTLRKPATPT